MMLPKKILRSVTVQCRNSSSGSGRNLSSCSSNNVWKTARLLIKGTGLTLGWGLSYLMFGGKVEELEEDRQKSERDAYGPFGGFVEIEDLREKMWPELTRFMWFRTMRRTWSDSDFRKDLEKFRCDFWRKNGFEVNIDQKEEEEYRWKKRDKWFAAKTLENMGKHV